MKLQEEDQANKGDPSPQAGTEGRGLRIWLQEKQKPLRRTLMWGIPTATGIYSFLKGWPSNVLQNWLTAELAVTAGFALQFLIITGLLYLVHQCWIRVDVPRLNHTNHRCRTVLTFWTAAWICWMCLYAVLTIGSLQESSFGQNFLAGEGLTSECIRDPERLAYIVGQGAAIERDESNLDADKPLPNNASDADREAQKFRFAAHLVRANPELGRLPAAPSNKKLREFLATNIENAIQKTSTSLWGKFKNNPTGFENLLSGGQGPKGPEDARSLNRILVFDVFDRSIEPHKSLWWDVLADAFNNATTIMLLFAYISLAHPFLKPGILLAVSWAIGIFALEGIGMLLTPLVTNGAKSSADFVDAMQWIGGFAAAMAIGLVVGRFESRWLSVGSRLIAILYGYAAIQVSYGAFGHSEILQVLAVGYALVGKTLMLVVLFWAIDERILHFYFARIGDKRNRIYEDRSRWIRKVYGNEPYCGDDIKEPLWLYDDIVKSEGAVQRFICTKFESRLQQLGNGTAEKTSHQQFCSDLANILNETATHPEFVTTIRSNDQFLRGQIDTHAGDDTSASKGRLILERTFADQLKPGKLEEFANPA